MKLDEIVKGAVSESESMGEILAAHSFDYQLSLFIGEGTYSRDFDTKLKTQIHFIVTEYITNARKAVYGTDKAPYQSPEAERLKAITCRIEVRLEEKERGYVISVTDNGDGIPSEDQEKIFRDQFSTRGTTGLGLKAVLNAATYTLNGHVDFTSEVGKGSTFYLYLPKA